MEIKAKIQKPYTEEEKINFIVEYNHNQGYEIRETEEAIEAWGYTEEEIAMQEKERIAGLNMTRGDFFEGLILAQDKDEDDVLALIEDLDLTEIEKKIAKSRVKNALDFYRGYPLIDKMCEKLGLSTEQMTMFFETGDYTYLLPTKQVEEETEQVEVADESL